MIVNKEKKISAKLEQPLPQISEEESQLQKIEEASAVEEVPDLEQAVRESKDLVIRQENLPPVNETEIEKMILNPQERDFKARIWTNLNKAWLLDQKTKKRQQKALRKQMKATNSVLSSSSPRQLSDGQQSEADDVSDESGGELLGKRSEPPIAPTSSRVLAA